MLIPPGESVVETKSCKVCSANFVITDKDLEFYDKVSPVFNGKKESIPTPMLCPDCRQRRRLAFRNERKLYRRKCDLTGKELISIYKPHASVVVYEASEWRRQA
ncbi:MAG TPA: zinc-ribbon domain containing protein [bacterium]|nr:zinc-ribbon domain containing protein [bacterium]